MELGGLCHWAVLSCCAQPQWTSSGAPPLTARGFASPLWGTGWRGVAVGRRLSSPDSLSAKSSCLRLSHRRPPRKGSLGTKDTAAGGRGTPHTSPSPEIACADPRRGGRDHCCPGDCCGPQGGKQGRRAADAGSLPGYTFSRSCPEGPGRQCALPTEVSEPGWPARGVLEHAVPVLQAPSHLDAGV